MILPQLDQSPLYSAINVRLPVQAPANTTATQTSLNVFLCPSDQIPGPGDQSYLAPCLVQLRVVAGSGIDQAASRLTLRFLA
jgi:Protein of unknown function (DUF1559)